MNPSILGINPLGDFWNLITGKTASTPPQTTNTPAIPWQVSVILIIGGSLVLVVIVKKVLQ